MNHDRDDQRHGDSDDKDAGRRGNAGPGDAHGEQRRLRRRRNGDGFEASRFTSCGLIARPSEWAEELESLGVQRFKRPEGLYKTIRSRTFVPAVCIVDLDAVPRNLIKAVDMRVPCPKLWIGRGAADPADIKNFGVYYARARPDELNAVMGRLIEVEQSMLLPAGLVGRRILPYLVTDKAYRERLHHYTDVFARTNLITLHGDDALELQLAAQTLAVETQRARIWDVKSEASLQSVLRRIAQARRPGSDVTIVLSPDIDVESARRLYKSMPSEYSMIKLAARAENPVDASSFTLPRPAERPADTENWVVWFVCRATIEHGIALAGLDEVVDSIIRAVGDDRSIKAIQSLCESSVRQHATKLEDRGEFVSYEDLVHNYERSILRRALAQHDWNLSATARSLGLAESSLRYKLKKLGVTRRDASN